MFGVTKDRIKGLGYCCNVGGPRKTVLMRHLSRDLQEVKEGKIPEGRWLQASRTPLKRTGPGMTLFTE